MTAVDTSPAPDPVSPTPTLDALAMQRAAMAACTAELRNTARLLSNPPQSSAAWDARNAIAAIQIDRAAALAEAMRLPEVKALVDVLTKVPRALNQSFSAGMEEREYGSAKRQAKCLEFVDAVRAEIDAALKGVK